jgi:hypothetical protein
MDLGGKRLWNKRELAEFVDCKVSYVEHKVRTRQWPSYLFHEIRFGPHHVEQILALSERPVKAPEPQPVEKPARARTARAASWRPTPPPDFVPLRARPERARSYKKPPT